MDQSTALIARTPSISPDEMAARTFLARYSGPTLETYTYGLRKFLRWCDTNHVDPLQVKRPILEMYIRWMEDSEIRPSTLCHQIGIVRGYYKYAVIDEYILRSPADNIRMPRAFEDDAELIGLDRLELGAILQAAKASNPTEWALVVMMGMLGMRVSEACSIQIGDFDTEVRGHRVLKFVGKGAKPATIPLPVPVQRALDAAKGDRTEGPLLLRQSGRRKGAPHNRMSVRTVVTRLAKDAHINKHVHPHMLRHAWVGAALDAGVPLRDVQIGARHADPRTTARYDRARFQLDRHAVHTVSAFLASTA